MIFNNGWLCPNCGPIAESKKRSIAKVSYDCCKMCNAVVSKWTRPITERAGRCGNCGNGKFKNRIVEHDLHRECQTCFEVYNIDKDKVVKKGEKKHAIN